MIVSENIGEPLIISILGALSRSLEKYTGKKKKSLSDGRTAPTWKEKEGFQDVNFKNSVKIAVKRK